MKCSVRELASHPRPGVVLIGDRVDAELATNVSSSEAGACAARGTGPARACSCRPSRDPERSRIASIDGLDDRLGAGREPVRADGGHAVARLALHDQRVQRGGGREIPAPAPRAAAAPRRRRRAPCAGRRDARRAHPRRRRRDEAFDVELVRVDEQPHERHLVVGLVRDVGHHDHARLATKGSTRAAIAAQRSVASAAWAARGA